MVARFLGSNTFNLAGIPWSVFRAVSTLFIPPIWVAILTGRVGMVSAFQIAFAADHGGRN
jgi:hypothetical protein